MYFLALRHKKYMDTSYTEKKIKSLYMIFNNNFSSLNNELFKYDLLRANDKVSAIRSRGAVYLTRAKNEKVIIKKYLRGGLISHYIKYSYLWVGRKRARSINEFLILNILYSEGYPVPIPLYARVIRSGLLYHADIITREIETCDSLISRLNLSPLLSCDWFRLGMCIKKFHNRGLYHRDLTLGNILINKKNEFFLIDMGKSRLYRKNIFSRLDLYRLKRSLNGQAILNPQFFFEKRNWVHFMLGYKSIKKQKYN